MNIFIDTSFLIALVIRKDKYHLKAKKIIEKYSEYNLYIDDLIKYESVNVLLRNSTLEKAKKLNKLLNLDVFNKISLTDSIWNNAFNQLAIKHTKSGPNVFDYIHFACMAQYGITDVLTFDNHFNKFGFNCLD